MKCWGAALKQLVASFLLACVQVAAIAWELRWCSDPMYSFIACRSSCSACRLCSTMRPLGFAVAGGWIPSASWMRDVYSALADHSAHFFNNLCFLIFRPSSAHPSCNHPFGDTQRSHFLWVKWLYPSCTSQPRSTEPGPARQNTRPTVCS